MEGREGEQCRYDLSTTRATADVTRHCHAVLRLRSQKKEMATIAATELTCGGNDSAVLRISPSIQDEDSIQSLPASKILRVAMANMLLTLTTALATCSLINNARVGTRTKPMVLIASMQLEVG